MTTTDPFRFVDDDQIGVVSFSGGRTSGYLLWRVLQAYEGELPENIHVFFCNTGLEMPQTLDFVQACSDRWEVPIRWIEYRPGKPGAVLVDHRTASRNGEPFRLLVESPVKRRDGTWGRRPLPNPTSRVCTTNLKFRAKHRYLRHYLGVREYVSAIGIRSDESHRANHRFAEPGETKAFPLVDAGIDKQTVLAFWAWQPFDLGLPVDQNGDTIEGNCDMCFMKSAKKVSALVQRYPERAEWWAQMEERAAASDRATTFRQDRPTYREMIEAVQRGEPMDFGIFDDLTSCGSHGCTD